MADESEVRELIGRMSAAQRQGFHVTPAGIRLVLAALRFYLNAAAALRAKPSDPHDDAPRKPPEKYTGPPATIGDMRRQGLVAITITCDGPSCWNSKRVPFDNLGLHESTPFPDIPASRGFRCQQCGSRRVRVSPDWTDHKAQGMGEQVRRNKRAASHVLPNLKFWEAAPT